jgi:hypothetical protein
MLPSSTLISKLQSLPITSTVYDRIEDKRVSIFTYLSYADFRSPTSLQDALNSVN